MTYSDLRVGDIILFRSYSILGWLIRLFTGSRFNHVALISSKDGSLIINEADKNGIVHRTFSECLDGKYIKIGRHRLGIDRAQFAKNANSLIGKKYDFVNLLAEQLLKSVTGIWRGDSKTEKFICSSYVAYVHNLDNWEQYSPADFEKKIAIFDFVFEGKLKN